MVSSTGSSQDGEFGLAGQSSSCAKAEAERKKKESSIIIIFRLRDKYSRNSDPACTEQDKANLQRLKCSEMKVQLNVEAIKINQVIDDQAEEEIELTKFDWNQ